MKKPSLTTRLTGALGIALMVLAGCDEQITMAANSVDKTDNCKGFYQQISAARKSDIQKQANTAMAAAVVGGILGALVGGRNNRMQGALAGALAGGLLGYADTYYKQLRKRGADSKTLLRNLNGDASKEHALVTKTGKSVAGLRACRKKQLRTLRANVKGGKISKSEAKAELRRIKSRVSADNRLVSAAFNGIGKRVDAYVDVTSAVARTDNSITAASARSRTPSVARVKTNSMKQLETAKKSEADLDAEIKALQVLLG